MFCSRFRLLSSLVVFMFLFTLFPAQAYAREEISVEKAINIVKSAFEVPEEYSNFTSGMRTEGEKKIISLSWEAPDNRSGRFEAQVDAKSGNIISMYRWSRTDEDAPRLPAITRAEAIKIAQELLQKAAPDKAGYLRMVENGQIVPISGYGTNLNLVFLRYKDNIPVENDNATVEINMADGQINNYYLNWSDTELPGAKANITAEEAGSIFAKEKMLELQYLLRQSYPPQKSQPPILIYSLTHRSGGMIDAYTGKPLVLDSGQYIPLYAKDMMAGGMGAATEEAVLTPQEIKEIEDLGKLLQQADADKLVRKLAEIPDEAALSSASLNQDYQDPSIRLWNLNYRIVSEDKPIEYYATINAESGELLSFNFWYNYGQGEADKPVLSREEALRKAEAWLKKVQPEKISQVKLIESFYPEEEEKYNPYNWTFNYQRVVNGVSCPGNNIYVSVDRASKKINSYNIQWSRSAFPGTGNVMGMEKANGAFLSHMPMTLTYVKEYDKNGNAQFHLVYVPRAVSPAQTVNLIDAVTGVKLDWEGKELKEKTAVLFDDIKGHFAEEQIEMLGQSGIMTEYGSSFRPDEAVKLVTVLRAMIIANDGPYNLSMTDEQVMEQAVSRKWIDASETADSQVSRARIAKLMISFLRLDFVAQKGDMFIIPFKDAAKIPAELKGYAGLTKGFGIISGDGTNFVPDHVTTRGETAAILIRTLSVRPGQGYYW